MKTLLQCLDDPNLFKPSFKEGDWTAWRTLMAALFAEALPEGPEGEAMLALYRERTGRATWPSAPFREAVAIVGRRGGKSRIWATIAVYLATTRNYTPYLAPGEVATIAVLAADVDQARVIFRYVLGQLKAVPLMRKMVVKATRLRILLNNRVVIEIRAASFRTARGYTFAAVLCDETAFWRTDESSANPDVEILRALRPGLATIPGSMLLIASSPYAKVGELYTAYRRYYGRDDAPTLVWKAPTLVMHPSLDKRIVTEAYESDPEAAQAEYDAEFREDLADFVTQEAIDAVTAWGRSELPPEPGISYRAFCDPSGGMNDAMTLAIAHLSRHGDVCILDALIEFRPKFDINEAVRQCAELMRRYGITTMIGDRYAGEWPPARFAEHGIEFVQSAKPKSDIYVNLLPLINARRVELLDHKRLAAQLCGLQRRTSRGGKASIDHAQGGHDDLANAVAGVLVSVDLDRRLPLVRLNDVLGADGQAPPLPRHCGVVFATVAVGEADVAVVYSGHSLPKPPHYALEPLYVLDVVAGPLWPGFDKDTVVRLREVARACTSPRIRIYAPANLAPLFEKANSAMKASPGRFDFAAAAPPDWFDAELSLAFAAGVVGRGQVKFCAPVADQMKTQTIGAALAFKAGDAVEQALRSAFILAIGLQFDHGLTSRPRRAV